MENLATISKVVWRDDASHMPAIVGFGTPALFLWVCTRMTWRLDSTSLPTLSHFYTPCWQVVRQDPCLDVSNRDYQKELILFS